MIRWVPVRAFAIPRCPPFTEKAPFLIRHSRPDFPTAPGYNFLSLLLLRGILGEPLRGVATASQLHITLKSALGLLERFTNVWTLHDITLRNQCCKALVADIIAVKRYHANEGRDHARAVYVRCLESELNAWQQLHFLMAQGATS